MLPPNLRVGTISWAKEDWAGSFYPDDLPSDGHLAHYAKRFTTVEVDATFYRTPTPQMCRRWAEQTPDGFRFAMKMMKRVTHDKVLEGCEADLQRFLAAAAEMGPKFAFGVLQFGYFNRKSACPDVGAFLKRLDPFSRLCPPTATWVVEVRNPAWIGPELLDFLRERRLAFALAETDHMPRPPELWAKYGDRLLTGGAAYARIFGERKKIEEMTSKFDKIIVDRASATREWIALFRAVLGKGVPVWAYYSNYYAGHAPGSVELFERLWEEKP